MKIESKGIEITEIPVFDSITVTPEEIILLGGGLDVDEDPSVHRLFRAEALALRDALTAALDAQEKMPNGVPAAAPSRVFEKSDAEPGLEIKKLIDDDGSYWFHASDGWSLYEGGEAYAWNHVLDYAPLTDVTNA